MARSRDIEYRVGFTGDTSQLEAAVKKATDSLTKLGTSPEALNRGLDGAARSALELSNHLNAAFNQSTGKLDLIKFQQSLSASGKNIQDYARTLSSIGPEGQQAFLEVASAIGKAELPLKRTNNLIKQFGQTLLNTARWRITTGAINAIVGGMQQAYGYAKSLDSSLNNIRIVTGKSAEDMAKFAKEANSAAKSLSTTTTTYTDASLIYYQQGLEDEQVKQRTDTTIKMANVTGESATTISDQMTAIWNNFDDGTRSLESFSDGMVALGATTAASSKEIAEGLEKFAPVAQTVGLSFDYAASALTTIVATTRESASVAGTALRTLFSRLEGLKLGETLDDGTDLNKYSSALMAVGVNIKDVQGNLKDMDTILDELGAKWQTLAKDQQMALAETVAGVRQYTQLVALMDNWGTFQKNLVTAQNSEGALQRQADIYAESWEAARKRVKAATEDIFDSLINPDQFIKLDDMFTPLLTGIASAVDALGGLTGMLPLVVMLMNKAFGDKIAQSLRDMTVNIGLMTGAEQKRARALQDTVAQAAANLGITDEENSVANTKVELLKEEIALQAEINSHIDNMPSRQRETLENDIKIADVLKEQAIRTAEILNNRRELADEAKSGIIATATNPNNITSDQLFANAQNYNKSNAFFIKPTDLELTNDFTGVVESLTNKLQEATEASAKVYQLSRALSNTKEVTAETKEEVVAFITSFKGTAQVTDSTEVLINKLKQIGAQASTAKTALKGALQNLDVDPKDLNVFISTFSRLIAEGHNAEQAIQGAKEAMQQAAETARASSAAFIDWADAFVKVGTYASQAAMAIRAIGNLSDIFSKDSELSSSEKWSQGLMSIAMLAPLAAKGLQAIRGIVIGLTAETKLKTLATTLDSQTSDAASKREIANKAKEILATKQKKLAEAEAAVETAAANKAAAKSENQRRAAINAEAKALKRKAAAQNDVNIANNSYIPKEAAASLAEEARNTTLTKQNILLEKKARIEEKLSGISNFLGLGNSPAMGAAALGVLVAYVAAAGTAVAIWKKQEEEIKKNNDAKIEAAKQDNETLKNNEALLDSYNALLKTYQKTGEGKEELAVKAKEIAAAFNVEGAALAELTGHYEDFTQKLNNAYTGQLETQRSVLETGIEGYTSNLKNKTGDTAIVSGKLINTLADNSVLGKYLQSYGPGGEQTSFNIRSAFTENAAETMANLLAIQRELENLRDSSNKTIADFADKQLKNIAAEIEGARELLNEMNIIDARGAFMNNQIQTFEEFNTVVETQTKLLKEQGLTAKEIESVITLAANKAGLEKFIEIRKISNDVLDSLKQYPYIAEQVENRLQNIKTLEEAEIYSYFPWAAVDENTPEFDRLMNQTKAYVKSLKEGSQATLDYENATKLLQQIQSNSGIKTKDLKNFSGVVGSDKQLVALLQQNEENQTIQINTIIQKSFEKQQQERQEAIENLQSLEAAASKAAAEAKEELTDSQIEEYGNVQDDWDNIIAYSRQIFEKIQNEEDASVKEAYISLWKDRLIELGILTQQEIDNLVNTSNIEDIVDVLDAKFKEKLLGLDTDSGGLLSQYFLNHVKALLFGEDITNLQQEVVLDEAQENARLQKNAEQAKSFSELNKTLKLGNTNQENYNKKLVELAKQSPKATKALETYNKELQKGKTEAEAAAIASNELIVALKDDALTQAAEKIQDIADAMNKAGALETSEGMGSMDYTSYITNINKIADALKEAFGYDVDADWVQQHKNLIKNLLSSDAETVQQAATSLDWSGFWNSNEFKTQAAEILGSMAEVDKWINILDGENIVIDGSADLSKIVQAAVDAGGSLADLANLINLLSNANTSFTVTGLEGVIAALNNPTVHGATFTTGDSELDTKIAVLDALAGVTIESSGGTGLTGYVPSGGGGGGGSNKEKDLSKDLEDIEDRYHEINRLLERQERVLSRLDKQIARTYGLDRLDLYDQKIEEINQKIELLETKNREAMKNLDEDRKILTGEAADKTTGQTLFGTDAIEFGIGGEIKNYQKVLADIVEEYNTAINEQYLKQRNDDGYKDLSEDEKQKLEEIKKQIEDRYNAQLEALKHYEDSLDNVNEIFHKLEDERRRKADEELNKITYRMEVILDVHDARKQIRDFAKEIQESFGDALTHGKKVASLGWEQARDDMAMYNEYLTEYNQLKHQLDIGSEYIDTDKVVAELKELEGNVIETGQSLLEWLDYMEEIFTESLSAASERFSYFINRLEHNGVVLASIKELYALQGQTYKTEAGFNRLQKTAQSQLDNAVAQAQLQKKWFEEADSRLAIAQQQLDDLIAEQGANAEYDVRYDTLKKNRDALLEEQQEAQKAMLEQAQQAMEIAQQMYLDQIEKAKYDFDKTLSGGLGLDILQEKYDHYLEEEERYLDKVNEGYQVSAWYNKLQQDIDKTTDKMMKNRLKELQEEVDIRREGNTLSQYDLDILEAKYKVLQAQIALEDAQNNKTQLRLVRDSNGNWNYQYTANQDDIAAKQQELLDAENEWYNIAKEQTKNVTGEIISTWQECSDKINEIYSDTSNFVMNEETGRLELTQEAQEREMMLREFYANKVKYLEEEKAIAISDMTEAGNQSMVHMAIAAGDAVVDLTGITSNEVQDLVAKTGASGNELLAQNLTGMKELLLQNIGKDGEMTNILRGNNQLIEDLMGENVKHMDLFDNVFAKDLGDMTSAASDFEANLLDYISNMQDSFNDFGSTMFDVATDSGTALSDLDSTLSIVSSSTEMLRDAGFDAAESLWAQVDAAWAAQMAYLALASTVKDVVDNSLELGKNIADTITEASKVTTFENIPLIKLEYKGDLSQKMAAAAYNQDWENYEIFKGQREEAEAKFGTEKVGSTENIDNQLKNMTDDQLERIATGVEWIDTTLSQYTQEEKQEVYDFTGSPTIISSDTMASNATGGYTGDFSGGKIGILHEKELILNADDTKNILAAVHTVRALSSNPFTNIADQLDRAGVASMAALGMQLGGIGLPSAQSSELEQHVIIESVSFPGVTSSREIEEAFENLVNDAAQWARRRKS